MISYVIPAYQSEANIRACIESILQQGVEMEVIIVNDGSTDRTGEIINELAYLDSRIKPIHCQNGGVSAARNIGISRACGKYIQFVDSDDIIAPGMSEKMMAAAEKSDAELVICGYRLVDYKGKRTEFSWESDYGNLTELGKDFERLYLDYFFSPPWNKLFLRNNITKTFNEKFYLGEDTVFNFEYMLGSLTKLTLVPDIFYEYRQTEDGLTGKFRFVIFETLIYKYRLVKQFSEERLKMPYGDAIAEFATIEWEQNIRRMVEFGLGSREFINNMRVVSDWFMNNRILFSDSYIIKSVVLRLLINGKYSLLYGYIKLRTLIKAVMKNIMRMKKEYA